MIISFEGKTLTEVQQEIRAFLGVQEAPKEEENAPWEAPKVVEAPKTEQKYTAADVRNAFSKASAKVSRDDIRHALKDIAGAESVSAVQPEFYPALIQWAEKVIV